MFESLTYTKKNLTQCQGGKRVCTTSILKKMAGSYFETSALFYHF